MAAPSPSAQTARGSPLDEACLTPSFGTRRLSARRERFVAAKMTLSVVEHGVQTDVCADMPFVGSEFESRSADEYAR
jgi:hypothetical protein